MKKNKPLSFTDQKILEMHRTHTARQIADYFGKNNINVSESYVRARRTKLEGAGFNVAKNFARAQQVHSANRRDKAPNHGRDIRGKYVKQFETPTTMTFVEPSNLSEIPVGIRPRKKGTRQRTMTRRHIR